MASNFLNPTPISDQDFANILALDFLGDTPTEDKSENIEESDLSMGDENENKEQFVSTSETGSKSSTAKVPIKTEEQEAGIDLDLDSSSTQTEKETKESKDSLFTDLINELADQELLLEAYEGFDPEKDADKDTFVKMLEHNINVKVDQEMNRFFDTLSDQTRRILEFDLNAKGKNIEEYLRTLVEEHNIKNLSVDNEYDQEKILREWYRNKEGFTQQEIEEKINNLKEGGILEKEAKLVKPKLDKEAETIAKQKEEEQRNLRELENRVRENFSNKLIDSFKDPKSPLKQYNLSKEDAARLHALLTSEDIEVTLHGNKKTTMSPLEAIIFYNKYDAKGSIENLVLATLLLTDPEKFEKEYAKRVTTKETETFIKEHKYSNSLKRSSDSNSASSSTKNKQDDIPKWRLKI